MIRVIALFVFGILAVVVYWFSDPDRGAIVTSIFRTLISGAPSINQDAFQRGALDLVNSRRSEMNLASLHEDPEIHDALARFGASQNQLSKAPLKPLFATLQKQFPGAQYLSATVLLDPRDSGLQSGIAKWEDAANPQYESISTLAFRDGFRQGCIAVLSRRLPAFDLEVANRDGGRFFQVCPHCHGAHAIQLDKDSPTVILACPECGKPYDVLAADPDGQFHRATEYFEGFKLPTSAAPSPVSPEALMTSIWSTVLRHCKYEFDTAGLQKGEAWKTPSRTWRDAAGDCEDTSILLVDALISAGIDARLAIGWNIHIGQHAWCVARIGDRQWILESTLRLKEGQLPKPVPVSEGAEEYQPEQLVDPRHLHFRVDGKDHAGCDDYWATERWISLEPSPKAKSRTGSPRPGLDSRTGQ